MEALLAFIAKYWLGFILAAAGAGVTAIYNKIKERYRAGKAIEEQKRFDDFKQSMELEFQSLKSEVLDIIQKKEQAILKEEAEISCGMKDLQNEIATSHNEIYRILETSREVSRGYRDLYQEGLLYTLRRTFFTDCEELLRSNHVITFEEFKLITEDHDLYNRLGGNHQGDILFKAVEEKYHGQTHQ